MSQPIGTLLKKGNTVTIKDEEIKDEYDITSIDNRGFGHTTGYFN